MLFHILMVVYLIDLGLAWSIHGDPKWQIGNGGEGFFLCSLWKV